MSPETTAWDKPSITLVEGTMMIAYNFSHMITLILAYLTDDVKNASGGTKSDAEAMLYVTVGVACLFEALALWVCGKMIWQNVENTYEVLRYIRILDRYMHSHTYYPELSLQHISRTCYIHTYIHTYRFSGVAWVQC